MADEQTTLQTIENIMFPSSAPAPKAPAPQAPPPLPDGIDEDDAELVGAEEAPAPEQPAEDAPFDGIELETPEGLKKLSKAELKALYEEHGTIKESAESLKAQRQAVEQEKALTAKIREAAPIVESLRAEGRFLYQSMQQLNQEIAQLAQTDPVAAYQKREAFNQLQGRFNQIVQQEAGVSQYLTQMEVQRFEAETQAAWPALLERLPKWRDATKRQSDQTFIREYMKREGYSDQETMLATKPHYVLTLMKAAKYDAIKAARASKKVSGAPPIAKPGTPSTASSQRVAARSEYHKALRNAPTESVRTKATLKRIESLIK